MIYFDTAYLAKCYLNEPGSEKVRTLAAADGRVACCVFGRLELAATFQRNFREKKISARQREIIFAQLELDERNHLWTWLPFTANLLQQTADKFRKLNPSLFLRAADALHLACAAEHGFKEIYSNDRRLLEAAEAFKLKGRDILSR